MKKFDVYYGMPEVGGPGEIPHIIPGPPGFGTMPDPNEPEPEHIPHGELKPLVHVADGALVKGADVTAEVLTEKQAEKLNISCSEDLTGGITVTGKSTYDVTDSKITLSGNCVNDFDGNGAGIQVLGESVVTVKDTEIVVDGVLRSCLNANEHATMYVENCVLTCKGGEVPEGWPGAELVGGPGMVEAPPSMGVSGHSRLSLTEGNAHSYFKNCKVVSDGWAGLSTDGAWGDCYLQAQNCDIEVLNPGYGTFSDEGCLVVFDDCRMKTASHTIMLDRKGKARMSRIQAESGQYFAFFFSVLGNSSQVNELIVSDCDIKTGEDAFLVSGCNAYIDIRNTRITAENGVAIRSELSQDPMNSPVEPGEKTYGVKVVLSDMELCGDILHEDTNRQMAVTLKHATVKGAIKDAFVTMDIASRWYAAADSNVKLVGTVTADQLDAPEGVTIYVESVAELNSGILASGGKLVVK